MIKPSKIYYFDYDNRDTLPDVIRSIKAYLRNGSGEELPRWVIFLTSRGEGPMLAYRELIEFNVRLAAVTFSATFSLKTPDGRTYTPAIPDKVVKFFQGVEIPIITNRLPFDPIDGANAHNKETELLIKAFSIFGGGVPLAIQAVLQACDAGIVKPGERVIAATGDCALLISASGTKTFLDRDCGLVVCEIICKPRSRKPSEAKMEKADHSDPKLLPKQA